MKSENILDIPYIFSRGADYTKSRPKKASGDYEQLCPILREKF